MKFIIDGSRDSVWNWDLLEDTFTSNIHTKEAFAYKDPYEKDHNDWIKLIHEDDREKVKISVEDFLKSEKEKYENIYRLRSINGDYRWILSTGKAERNKDGQLIRLGGSHTDITKEKKLEEKIENTYYYNNLTKMYNQAKLKEYIQDNINLTNKKFSLIYLDVDNFRRINDTWGYYVGDKLLKYIADTLMSYRDKDFVYAHLSSDNFAIIANNITDKEVIRIKLNSLLEKFEEPWEFKGQELYVTFSIGIASFPKNGVDLSELLVHADNAMWDVKKSGKDGMSFYDKSMGASRLGYIQTAGQIDKAISNNELELYYQPQVELVSGKVISFEALIRWNHPKRGFIAPGEFIPLAERSGQIYLIFNYVFEEVCRQKLEWQELGYEDKIVSINISGVTLTRKKVYGFIKDTLEKYKIKGSTIVIEVTETAIMTNLDLAIETLRKIKTLGIKVSLDDFGTGYSSLTYLNKLPIDVVKIDREFIKNIKTDKDEDLIVKTVIHIAEALDLEVVAEGVETKDQLDYLMKLDCMHAQGYYFAKPVPAKKLNNILEDDFRYFVKAKKVYAVRVGRKTGIFNSWEKCKRQIFGFSGAEYKSFKERDEAQAYMEKNSKPKNVIHYTSDDGNKSTSTMVAYVDGSYNSEAKEYGSGVVILWKGKKQSFKYKGDDPDLASMRNVAGEIIAAQKAMEFARDQEVEKIIIYYDYEGIEKWCTGDWKANKEGTKSYRDACQEIKKKIKIEFVKIAAHTGDKYNEEADVLAKEAIGL